MAATMTAVKLILVDMKNNIVKLYFSSISLSRKYKAKNKHTHAHKKKHLPVGFLFSGLLSFKLNS